MYRVLSLNEIAEKINLDEYHSYVEVVSYMKSVTKKNFKGLGVSFKSIGQTFLGRDINILTISQESLEPKKIVVIECGTHAREWVSVATCLKLIDKFVVNPDSVADAILNKYNVHIIPILNPDGYEYSRNNQRSWRKNRSRYWRNTDLCSGTDVNRNFQVGFGTVGVDTKNPCSLIYCGKKAFSEYESQALRDHVLSIKDSLQAYISIHSFSQLLLYPFGFKNEVPENNDELKRLAILATDAIRAQSGESYASGNIYTAIYPASGSTINWVALNSASKYNWVFEMRDKGKFGFMLPEKLIHPAFLDVYIGMEQLLLNMKD